MMAPNLQEAVAEVGTRHNVTGDLDLIICLSKTNVPQFWVEIDWGSYDVDQDLYNSLEIALKIIPTAAIAGRIDVPPELVLKIVDGIKKQLIRALDAGQITPKGGTG
jgi:hypothetical protein